MAQIVSEVILTSKWIGGFLFRPKVYNRCNLKCHYLMSQFSLKCFHSQSSMFANEL